MLLPAVTRINRIDIGYRSAGSDVRQPAETGRELPEESLMLTGDENIVDINFSVFWRIRDAGAFLFNTRNPAYTVKSAAESVMREVIGRTPIQPALTTARAQTIETKVQELMQKTLDSYHAGIDGNAILGDTRCPVRLVEHDIATLRAERHLHCVVEDVDPAQHSVARIN